MYIGSVRFESNVSDLNRNPTPELKGYLFTHLFIILHPLLLK